MSAIGAQAYLHASGGEMIASSISRRDFVKTTAALAPAIIAPFTRAPTPAGEGFDYVIAGAGHNSLVCAAYLAKAGNRVLVLEWSAMIGGGVKTAEVLLPGYKTDLCATVHGGINQNPLIRDNEIPLRDYGYETIEPDVVVHIPFLDGASFTVYCRDVARTAATIARVSKEMMPTRSPACSRRARRFRRWRLPNAPGRGRESFGSGSGTCRATTRHGRSGRARTCGRPISPPAILPALPAAILEQATRPSR